MVTWNTHCFLMATLWLLNLQASCLCSRQEVKERTEGERANGEKALFSLSEFRRESLLSLFRRGTALQGLLLYLSSWNRVPLPPRAAREAGKISVKFLLFSPVEEGKGEGTRMPFGLSIHSFSRRLAKAPGRGGLGGFWGGRFSGGQG